MNSSTPSQKARQKREVLDRVVKKEITIVQAAGMLELSTRQVKRLKKGYLKEGKSFFVHKSKGKISHHHTDTAQQTDAILTLAQSTYKGFGPTFMSEQLAKRDGIDIHPETLRLLLIKHELWKKKTRKSGVVHMYRERKACCGELMQYDGSYYIWFGEKESCLLGAIDDATGRIYLWFAPNEGFIASCKFWKKYFELYGKPSNIYLDKFSTYKVNHPGAVDDPEMITQLERIMGLFHVSFIFANSPQAKGRIERLWKTLQDRLVKELRLEGITSLDEANLFLKKFMHAYNEKYMVIAQNPTDLHMPLTTSEIHTIDHLFSRLTKRIINNDFTIQFHNVFYQLHQQQQCSVLRQDSVYMEESIKESPVAILHVRSQQYLFYTKLKEKPSKIHTKKEKRITALTSNHPSPTHPWRQYQSL